MVALPIARLWAAERGLATVAPHDECDITQKGGQFPTAAPHPRGEPSSWPKRPERSPSLVWL
jgi:hypothetical protein